MELIYFTVNHPRVKKDGETVNKLTCDDTNLPTKLHMWQFLPLLLRFRIKPSLEEIKSFWNELKFLKWIKIFEMNHYIGVSLFTWKICTGEIFYDDFWRELNGRRL